MPYLRNFTHDIFVSYSMQNNKEKLDGQAWVSQFIALLQDRLINLLDDGAKALSVYYAEGGSMDYGERVSTCLEEARKSAIFLMIGSPRYLDDWPTSELAAFAEPMPWTGRLFVAEFMPLPEGRAYPAQVADGLRPKFFSLTQRKSAQPFGSSGDPRFSEVFTDFAEDIASALERLRKAAVPSAGRQRPYDATKRPVLVGRVTDDLADRVQELRKYLGQFDIEVLPQVEEGALDDGYPEEGAAFRDAFAGYLQRKPLVVQLLGPHVRRSARVPEGYAAFQAEAGGKAGADLLHWSSLQDTGGVADPAHRSLLDDTAKKIDFELFKPMVVDKANWPVEPPPLPVLDNASQKSVFIDAHRIDEKLAKAYRDALGAANFIVQTPLFGFDTDKDLRAYYARCDHIVIVHGDSDLRWLNGRFNEFVKADARSRAKGGKHGQVVLTPAPPKSKDDVNFRHPRLAIVECAGPDAGPILPGLA